MDRIAKIREYVNDSVEAHCRLPDKLELYAHLHGVAAACALLAAKRRLDPEIACACGLMHDLYACRSGSYTQHGPSGAEMARVALRRMGCFSDEEQLTVRSAINHHSDKAHMHDPYDELLKDADTLYPFLQNVRQALNPSREARMRRMAAELGIPFSPLASRGKDGGPEAGFDRRRLAGIAAGIAGRPVEGSPEDAAFQDILRYWPENEAFGELKNGWCAAFVYHCCLLAALELPIRYPGAGVRFAGVGAWLEWAQAGGLYFDTADFTPEPGDIVIYDNVIPAGKKEQGGRWHDHIGIVLEIHEDSLSVAEGNVGNGNVSGIVSRGRHEHIGGFVRIPDGYEYDGWKIDYKTGKVRIEPFGTKG